MRTPHPGEMSAAADALRREKPKTAAWITYRQADFIYMGVLKSLSYYGGKWYNKENLKLYVIQG